MRNSIFTIYNNNRDCCIFNNDHPFHCSGIVTISIDYIIRDRIFTNLIDINGRYCDYRICNIDLNICSCSASIRIYSILLHD